MNFGLGYDIWQNASFIEKHCFICRYLHRSPVSLACSVHENMGVLSCIRETTFRRWYPTMIPLKVRDRFFIVKVTHIIPVFQFSDTIILTSRKTLPRFNPRSMVIVPVASRTYKTTALEGLSITLCGEAAFRSTFQQVTRAGSPDVAQRAHAPFSSRTIREAFLSADWQTSNRQFRPAVHVSSTSGRPAFNACVPLTMLSTSPHVAVFVHNRGFFSEPSFY